MLQRGQMMYELYFHAETNVKSDVLFLNFRHDYLFLDKPLLGLGGVSSVFSSKGNKPSVSGPHLGIIMVVFIPKTCPIFGGVKVVFIPYYRSDFWGCNGDKVVFIPYCRSNFWGCNGGVYTNIVILVILPPSTSPILVYNFRGCDDLGFNFSPQLQHPVFQESRWYNIQLLCTWCILNILSFTSLYMKNKMEPIDDVNNFTEAMEQQVDLSQDRVLPKVGLLFSLGDTLQQNQATILCDIHSRDVKSSRQKLHGLYSNLHYCNHVFSLNHVNVQLVSFQIRFLQDQGQGWYGEFLSILIFISVFYFTFLFTFGKKHYYSICSGYNHEAILYPVEYDDGKQEHCILAMTTVLQIYDGQVHKNHQSRFLSSHMQFAEQHHKRFVRLHFSNEMDLPCWTKQVNSYPKTSVVFRITIFVYEPFEVDGGVLLVEYVVEKQQHP